MTRRTIKWLSFTSFVKLSSLIWAAFGFCLGIFMLVASLFGGEAFINLGTMRWTGLIAGILGIVFVPPLFALCGALAAVVSFLPFQVFLKLCGGIALSADYGDDRLDQVLSALGKPKHEVI